MSEIKFITLKYDEISNDQRNDIYKLRKSIFNDRLNWQVTTSGEFEFDEYDNQKAIYLVGQLENKILCGVRLLPSDDEQMLAGPFRPFFSHPIIIDDKVREASRFFVDKQRSKKIAKDFPSISQLLFLGMVNYGLSYGLVGITATVSRAMRKILTYSGWDFDILDVGRSEKGDIVYFIYLQVDKNSQKALTCKINEQNNTKIADMDLQSWPMYISQKHMQLA